MLGGGRPLRLRYILIGLCTSFLVVYLYRGLFSRSPKLIATQHDKVAPMSYAPRNLTTDLSHLPPEYQEVSVQRELCEERFGFRYLTGFRRASTEYCEPGSKSHLTCFSSVTDAKGARTDSFCIAGSAKYDVEAMRFSLDCRPRSLADEEIGNGIQPLDRFPAYWYDTGPRFIFDNHVRFDQKFEYGRHSTNPRSTKILIKREHANFNMWHSLMEIMSAFMTLDILTLTIDPTTRQPYYDPADFDRTQVVLLDDIADGPFIQLWSLFARKPVVRLASIDPKTSLPWEDVVLPLPGGSNPFWQGDWEVLPCTDSPLLRAFSHRVLDFYKIPRAHRKPKQPLVITFIDRTTKRLLRDQDKHIAALELRLKPLNVTLNVVDYATLPFDKQLAISHSTDVLVGVHGAGLTHGMFLPPKSVIVEFMPFKLKHKGFQNLAKMLGHQYLGAQTLNKPEITEATGDWQEDDVCVDQNEFLNLIEDAVKKTKESRMKKRKPL